MAGERFPTTRLSLVLAIQDDGSRAADALAELCRAYWRPLHAYVRRQGHDAARAEDLTQAFIVRLLETGSLRRFDRERGRFRSFLLASLKNFLSHERAAEQAARRGGGRDLPLAQAAEPRDEVTPDQLFERQWALELLGRAMDRVRRDSERAGKAELFERLKGCLPGDVGLAHYSAISRDLGMSEGAVKVAVHRLRRRFHEALREEISMTVTDDADIGAEIRYLLGRLTA